MHALIIAAHGSKKQKSNDEVILLAKKLSLKLNNRFEVVWATFLETANPTIPTIFNQCKERGVQSITLLPYFLNSGKHVSEDLPQLIADLRVLYPMINIHILPHLGAMNGLESLIIESLPETGS